MSAYPASAVAEALSACLTEVVCVFFCSSPLDCELRSVLCIEHHVQSIMCRSAAPQGFQSVYKPQRTGTVQFAELLDAVASVDPEMRIRFTSPHPKDFSDDVLKVSPVVAWDVLIVTPAVCV